MKGIMQMKALANISAWVLFIFAWVMLINTIIQSLFFGLSEQMTMVASAIAMTSFFLTAVTAKIKSNI
jgi:hypothetical protein